MRLKYSLNCSVAIVVTLTLSLVNADVLKPSPPPSANATVSAPLNFKLPVGSSKPLISAEEWQELASARVLAMKQHPELVASGKALSIKMQAFQERLKQAMIAEDPQVAQVFDLMMHRGQLNRTIQLPPSVLRPSTSPSTSPQ